MGNCNSEAKYGGSKNLTSNDSDGDHNSDICIHNEYVSCISTYKNKLLTCSGDKRIALFAADLSGEVKYFHGHSKSINRILGGRKFIWSASRDLSIKQVIYYLHACICKFLI